MNRDYAAGIKTDSVVLFTGIEVEKTVFHNQKTLFVVGVQNFPTIIKHVYDENCEHVYLGANHSASISNVVDMVEQSKTLIEGWNKNVTLDIDISLFEYVSGLIEGFGIASSQKFCLIISCKLPNIEKIRNGYIKVDDLDFKYSNSGVWLHQAVQSLSETTWVKYTQDKILQTTVDIQS